MLVIFLIQAASSHWWNFRHFQHHAKPNILKKDPDVDIALLFLLGDKLPVKWGNQKRGFMPYQHQHNYFWTCKSIEVFGETAAILAPNVYLHILLLE